MAYIILRSINQHIIFEDDSDYQKFLFILKDCKKKYDIEIYAYCIMDNHIHLLIYSSEDKLSKFFQSLETRFVHWYNIKYLRYGHLFQGRFFSRPIECSKAFLSALVYIHNNPVKANICRYASEYRWSSYNVFYGANNPLVNVSFSYDIAGTKEFLLKYFAKEPEATDNSLFENDHREKIQFFTDEKALDIFKDTTRLPSTSAVSELTKVERNEYVRQLRKKGLRVKQIARIMDISEATVKRLSKIN
ncbi:MAG: transposase [Lachnospiraceae bacterium]|nr:transposase [Lachnospiraceae bacterium]